MLRPHGPKGRSAGRRILVVRCECGTEARRDPRDLRRTSSSCGCAAATLTAQRSTTHGETVRGKTTAEWRAWAGMRNRCHSETSRDFPRYGGRGIRVCDEWRNDYVAFRAYVGPRPSPRHSIDRINNNGNYEPGNVRWAIKLEQTRNRRNARNVTAFGLTLPLGVWAKAAGQRYQQVWARLRKGEKPEAVLAGWSPWGEAFPA